MKPSFIKPRVGWKGKRIGIDAKALAQLMSLFNKIYHKKVTSNSKVAKFHKKSPAEKARDLY